MRNREECRSGSKYNLMQKTSFERIGLWARGKSAGVSETSFCGLQRERGEIWSRKGRRGRRGDPMMVLTQTLCKRPNKNEDKNETESGLRWVWCQ